MNFAHTNTNRGFELIDFKDAGGHLCSLQESSSTVPRIWVGMNKGTHIEGQCCARMHLDIETAKEVVKYMQRWIETGSFQDEEEDEEEEKKQESKVRWDDVGDIIKRFDRIDPGFKCYNHLSYAQHFYWFCGLENYTLNQINEAIDIWFCDWSDTCPSLNQLLNLLEEQ